MPFCDSAQINNEGVAARGEIERERRDDIEEPLWGQWRRRNNGDTFHGGNNEGRHKHKPSEGNHDDGE